MSDIDHVWLAQRQGYEEGVVLAILPTRSHARLFIEDAHDYYMEQGRELEKQLDEDDLFDAEGLYMPGEIEELAHHAGWGFDITQGGPGHGHISVMRVPFPYYDTIWEIKGGL